MIDLAPQPTGRVFQVNIDGTANILAACRANGAQVLIYTRWANPGKPVPCSPSQAILLTRGGLALGLSSIDVVFRGKPICNGDEGLPIATHPCVAKPDLCFLVRGNEEPFRFGHPGPQNL
jgi:hypothetical protein